MKNIPIRNRTPREFNFCRQAGMATLLVTVMLLLLISVGVFSTGRSVLSEVKATQNTYWSKRALQKADGGIEYAMAWLSLPTNDPQWAANETNPPNDMKGMAITYTEGDYSVNVVPFRKDGSDIIELISTATGTDRSRATVRQQIALLPLLVPGYTNTPLVINGCLSGVTGTPNAGQNASGTSIATSQAGSCIQLGHLAITGGIQQNAFNSSAWNAVFGMGTTELKAFSGTSVNESLKTKGGGVYFYDSANPAPVNFHESVGTSTNPAVIVFGAGSGCPKINGSPVIYGIVYFDTSCASNDPGWGGALIFGSVVVDGSISKFTANGQLNAASYGIANFNVPATPVRVLGSWRDF
jgi:hypothetical protein